MEPDNGATLVLDVDDSSEPPTSEPAGLETLLFAVSLITALPATAMLAPPHSVRPALRPHPPVMLTAMELSAVVFRPTTEIGRWKIALGEIDSRLHGLESAVTIFRVTNRSGGLICLSVVRPDPKTRSEGSVTPARLYQLAYESVARLGVAHEHPARIGEQAFLALYGGVTAQVAWLDGDLLATASVTCLAGNLAWAADAARALAAFLDVRLTAAAQR
jgi:hypothetical protein